MLAPTLEQSLVSDVFCLGLLENRETRIGLFSKREKILAGSLGLAGFARQRIGSPKTQVRQCGDYLAPAS